MSANKQIVESYFASTGTGYAQWLADDVELVEWADGVPPTGVRTRGKDAFVQNRGSRENRTHITRLVEEDQVVVAEGTVTGMRKDGGSWAVQFCDIFELEAGKIRRMTSFGATLKDSV